MTLHATLHASQRARGSRAGCVRTRGSPFPQRVRRAKKKPSLPRPACRVTLAHFHRRARMTGEALTGVAEERSGSCHSFADPPPRGVGTRTL